LKNNLIKKLFQNMMDEVLPDDLSELSTTVKDVINEPDKMTTKGRNKNLFRRHFKGPDPATIPTPHLMSDKENNIVDLDNIYEINCDEANSMYRTQIKGRKKSKLKNISNEESGKTEE